MIFGTWHKLPISPYYYYYYYFLVLHGYSKFVCMLSAKTYWRMLFTSLARSVIF